MAFMRLAGDELVAVKIATGEVAWRKVGLGRPIGLVPEGLVTIARDGDRVRAMVVDAETGMTRRVIANVPLPDWIAGELHHLDGFTAAVVERGGEIEVPWKARRLYREGAPPRQTATESSKEVQGRFRIPVSGDVAIADTAPSVATVSAEPQFEAPMETTLGDRRYTLESVERNPNEVSVVLKSHDRHSGSVLWQSEIKRLPRSRPPPLRM
jgi:hypothetical protein